MELFTNDTKQSNQLETRIEKNHYGWRAESMSPTDANGKAWQITTSKKSSGVVSCSAMECTNIGGGMVSFDMLSAKRLSLASNQGQCTEKNVRTTHEAGLKKFYELIEQTPEIIKPAYILGVGQIVFSDGHGSDYRRVIYEVPQAGIYKTVMLDGTDFRTEERLKPYTEKFGIGSYYNEGELMNVEDIPALVAKATQYQIELTEAHDKTRKALAQDKADKIAIGSQTVKAVPAWASSVIVAELMEDDSDPYSDYHASHTVKTVFLAWSKHTRDIFQELRNASAKFEETATHKDAPVKPEDASKWWKPEDEHREKYSMGSGYYLGSSKYSGWIVRKRKVDTQSPEFLEVVQIASAEGRFLCSDIITEEKELPTVADGSIKIVEHPFRAGKILVMGETKPIKEELKSIGGAWWNRFEKGWEYKADKMPEIIALLQKLAANV